MRTVMPDGMVIYTPWTDYEEEISGSDIIQRMTYTLGNRLISVQVGGHPDGSMNGRFYFFTDHLGSVSYIVGSGGVERQSIIYYDPFGGYRSSPPVGTNPDISDRGFTGQKHRNELNLIDYNARWYMPGLGRFLSPDTIVPDYKDPQSLNKYAYTLNNPIRYSDPTGHYIFEEDPDDPNIVYPENYSGPVRCSGSCYPDWNDKNNNSPWWTPITALYAPALAYGLIPEAALYFLPTTTSVVETACADGDCGNEVQSVQTGANTVYQYLEDGTTKYIGITNNFFRRAAEHMRNGWDIQPIPGLDKLSRADARAVEQVLIEYYKLANLYNKINSIATSNPIYEESIKRGQEILQQIGFIVD